MNTPPDFCPESFSLDAEEDAHQACRRYERALRDGNSITIEQLLSEIEPSFRPLALYELVKTDVEFRQNEASQPTAADYEVHIDCPQAHSAVLTALQESAKSAPDRLLATGGSSPTEASRNQATSPTVAARTIPDQLGRYSIGARLGRGGMGTVFKAFDSRLKRFVALKVPHFDQAGDASIRERFRREALALAALQHDMIVAVHDVEQSGDYEFMTMALIEGETLRRYILEGRPLAQHQAAILCRALAKAMQYVHSSGVIHRDLKPENVIMEDGRKPVIVDFGLARSPGARELSSKRVSADLGRHVTRFGQVAGTPEYSSPEQLAGDFDAVGPQTDIYSLGVILFELLTGRLPWNGADGSEWVSQTGEVPLQLQACDLNPQVDRHLSAICARAMDSNQADRYQSMTDFAESLKPYCQVSRQTLEEPTASHTNADENINAVLREIARQAGTTPSRMTDEPVTRKRPLVVMVMILLVLSAALIVKLRRDHQDRIARQTYASTDADEDSGAVPLQRHSLSGLRSASRAKRPQRAIRANPLSTQPPPLPSSSNSATAASNPPADDSVSSRPQGDSQLASLPADAATETPPPTWRLASKRIIAAGGTIVFEAPSEDNDSLTRTVQKVEEIPTHPDSLVVDIVLAQPRDHRESVDDLRQLLETFPASIRNLDLDGVPLDQGTVSAIGQLDHLEQLGLRDVELTTALWAHLSRGSFPRLRRLDLARNHIESQDLETMLDTLRQTSAPLESLSLAHATGINKPTMERLARFPTLKRLDLTDATVSPAALVQLKEASGLAHLILAGVHLPDGSAKFLAQLPRLESIDLSRTMLADDVITDVVRAAQNLKRLKSIDLSNTRFSSAGVLALADRLAKKNIALTIVAGDRLDYASRRGKRRKLAMQHFQAGARMEAAIAAGIDWLLRNQQSDGTWSLQGPFAQGAAVENRAEATALALLVLQGHGYDGLGRSPLDLALRRGYQGLNSLVQSSGEPSILGPYGNALAALAVCDLHAMAGYRIQDNRHLPQAAIVDAILTRCRELQGNDGGWGEDNRSNALLTGWYVQALTSARAAGFAVDRDMLVGAKKFLRKLWRPDLNRYIYQESDRKKFVLGSHGSAATSLQLINGLPSKEAASLVQEKYLEAADDPYFCYYGTRIAINAGGTLWSVWNRKNLQAGLIAEQSTSGPERGSWFPSNVSDDGQGCQLACGRFYATCLHLLALEAYYRQLPLDAPVTWRTIDTVGSGKP